MDKRKKEKSDWNWSTYFAAKKQKLEQQFGQDKDESEENKLDDESKTLFKNVGIFVNGYTNPTAIELKSLMLKHGGLFYEYINDKVTHYIASNLAHSKALILKSKMVVKPEWILDCIKERKLLSTDPYVLITSAHDKNQNKLTEYISKNNTISPIVRAGNNNEKNSFQKKSNEICKEDIIDISSTPINSKTQPVIDATTNNYFAKNLKFSSKKKYFNEYECFLNKLKKVQLPDSINKNLSKSELEIERIKHLLDDWIFWTSKNEIRNFSKSSMKQIIDNDDLQIFKGYLFYLLNFLKDLEKLALILKILKRLILKNGSFEWIETYKEIYSSIQSDFYEQFDSTIKLD